MESNNVEDVLSDLYRPRCKLKALAQLFSIAGPTDGIQFDNADQITGMGYLLDGIADELKQLETEGLELAKKQDFLLSWASDKISEYQDRNHELQRATFNEDR